MRASIVVLGPLLARYGTARVSMPGGDDFGYRPIDFHLSAFEDLGATFVTEHGYVEGYCDRLRGAHIVLQFPSHTATDNVLMAAVLAKGTTVIENAAREPEISDLASMLNEMGAASAERGPPGVVEVEGVDELRPANHRAIPDRVEAATFVAAVGLAGGEVLLKGARVEHMDMFLEKLGQMGMDLTATDEGLLAVAHGRPLGRRLHLALPGRRDRLQTATCDHALDRGWCRDREREPFRRPLPLRRRAAPDGGQDKD